jgi:hypothetical protein
MEEVTRRSRLPAAAVVAFVLPVLYSPSLAASAWTPRAALLLVVMALGLPRIPALLRGPTRPAAAAAVAFVVVGAISTALAHTPALALFGLYNWGTGLLFMVALVAAWALGSTTERSAVPAVERALLAAVAVNVAVAFVQGALDLDIQPFSRYEGRAAGLLGNPVHLGALCVAALPLLLPRVRSRPLVWAPATAAVAAAVELSGSRFAIGLVVVVLLVTLAQHRTAALPAIAAVSIGLALGVGVGAAGGTATGSGRVAAGATGEGVAPRVHTWASARHSIARHPLVGVGPGQFRSATTPYRDLTTVRTEGPDRYFVDAHNLAVEYTTTTGGLGLAALAAWLFFAIRRARGPLLGFAAVALAMHLVEPQSVGITPVAFLALGAAAPVAVALRATARAVTATLLLVAAAAAALFVAGDFSLEQAILDFRAAPARAALRTLPPWPDPADVAGRVALFRWLSTQSALDRSDAIARYSQAVRRDPTNPRSWVQLAGTENAVGARTQAARDYREALRWDPWSVLALNGLAGTALADHQVSVARAALAKSLLADPHQRTVRRQLAELTGP